MPQKRITLLEATEFASENGYLYAVYEKQDDGNFHKIEDAIWEAPVDDNTEVMVETIGSATALNEFVTVDGKFCFRLHNNFNVPDIIPVIKKDQYEYKYV